jgi:hypothetical protein
MQNMVFYRPPYPEGNDGRFETHDYRKYHLSDLIKAPKDQLIYEYDFGDSWMHEILLEKILPFNETIFLPQCTDGKLKCPPGDCGGIGGYHEIYKMLTNPKAKQDLELLEWLGEEFNPALFDKDSVNQRLKLYFFRKPRKRMPSNKK